MVFVSIDCETSGINPQKDQIIEFGAVFVDTKQHPGTWESMHVIIEHERIEGTVMAIAMNHRIFNFLVRWNKDKTKVEEDWTVISPEELLDAFELFLHRNKYTMFDGSYTINVAGKNAASFDIPFIKEHFKRHNGSRADEIRFVHRVIDPAVMFTDFTEDVKLPSLDICLERAGLPNKVTHEALKDAWDVVMLVCHRMGYDFGKALTEEWLDENYVRDNRLGWFQQPSWVISKGIIVRKMEHSDGPFRKFKLIKMFDSFDNYVWNQDEVSRLTKNNIYEKE